MEKNTAISPDREDAYAAFMMDHAAGSLPSGLALAGDLHALLSEDGAAQAQDWAVIGGALLERFEPTDRVVAAHRRASTPRFDPRTISEMDFTALKWRRGLSGVGYAPTGVKGGRYMRLSDGAAAPSHGHKHLEATVVLEGAFEDGRGVYQRGDLVIAGEGVEHTPRAVGGDCICYVARERGWLWII